MLDKNVKKYIKAQFQPPASEEQAERSRLMSEQVESKTETERVIRKYELLIKVASKDMGRFKNFYRTGNPKGFLEDVSKYTADDWKEINEKLDRIIEDLDTVVVG